MQLNILCDADWEAKIPKVMDAFSDLGYRRFFEERQYGTSLEGVVIGLICQDPSLKLRQRIRYVKKEKRIYIDIMLDLNQFKKISQKEKVEIVSKKILNEIHLIIKKYRFESFDFAQFQNDLIKFFNRFVE